uniref:Filamentous hemagglutinin family N-terminal domain-containing protein n=1 Tax=Candidatus Kentrum sp. DK TaxID=2126562 RepID=A0A450RVP5_9GAMM|nr:MAG: filamentous hemagglutinin family N-terminal domain-containing protein [Candidatus Kentron sp. DK]
MLIGIAFSVLWTGIARAEIIMDGSIRTAGGIAGPSYDIQAAYGSEIGGNLFHSFSQFNIASGETAIFSGPGTIERIIVGVTGGQRSNINGTLQNTIVGADLFLLNPSGIFLGPDASLDLTGSFYATTANRLDLTDGGTFQADTTGGSVLTSAPPTAFGFSSLSPATITVSNPELAVSSGETLALAGGDIAVTGGAPSWRLTLTAEDGHIDIVSLGEAGLVSLGADGLTVSDSTALGTVNIADMTYLGVSGPDVGRISIKADNLYLSGASFLDATNSGTGVNGGIDLDVRNELHLSDASYVLGRTVDSGNAPEVNVQARSLALEGGSQLGTLSSGSGAGGRVDINVDGRLLISGYNGVTPSSVYANTQGAGNAGDINIQAGTVTIDDGGQLQSQQSLVGGTGTSGNITIDAKDIGVLGGGEIDVGTWGDGDGGDLSISASGEISVAGQNASGKRSTITTSSQEDATGNAGRIYLEADAITVDSGSVQSATTQGGAGEIHLRARRITSLNGSHIFTTSSQSSGGNIILDAALIQLINSPVSATVAGGSSDGGNVTINATTLAALHNSDITARADQGQGGNITVNADVFLRSPEVDLDASSNLIGNDGNVVVNAPELDLAGELEPAKATLSPATANLLGCATGLGTLSTAAGRITLDDLSGPEGPWLLDYPTDTSVRRGIAVNTPRQAGLRGLDSLLKGKPEEAARNLQTGVRIADQDLRVKAISLNNLGVTHRIRAASSGKAQGFREALERFDDAARIARKIGAPRIALAAQANALVMAPDVKMRPDEIERRIDGMLRILEANQSGPEPASVTPAAIGASVVALEFVETASWPFERLFRVAETALNMAKKTNDTSARARVLGRIAGLYAHQNRFDEARRLYASAASLAGNANMPEWSSHWWSKAGQLAQDTGLPIDGFSAWERAAEILWEHRQKLAHIWRLRGGTFRAQAGERFAALVRLVLEKPVVASGDLRKVQEMWERFKTAEVAEYFGACMLAAVRPLADSIGRDPTATILYPIVLPDRLELLVQRSKKLERRTVLVSEKELANTVKKLREAIMLRATEPKASERRIKELAHRLYRWLIAPIEHHLTAGETIVLVPDGPFRRIPPAVLHDGQRYLIEQFPVVEIPSLSLVAAGLERNVTGRILLGGVTKEMVMNKVVTEFPNIKRELDNLERLFGRSRTNRLDNDAYTKARLEQTARKYRYSIIHLASHARFDSTQGSGLLVTTGAEKMGAKDLAELVSFAGTPEIPVDILSLSACETALGDDRATLGLGGIAAGTGARSALATLWRVDSAASFVFTKAFYSRLKQQPAAPRGKLLQEAIRAVRAKQKFTHPFYWAGFLLIGDWMG